MTAGRGPWPVRATRAVRRESALLARRLWEHRITLAAVSRVEFLKKYSGSVLGVLWYPLHAMLLLGMYCFIYLVIFKARYRDFGNYEYVVFIFAGLVPYIGFSEAVTASLPSIRSNIALVKNTVFPIELVPLKHLLASMAALTVSLAVLVVLVIPSGRLGPTLLYLPVPFLLLLVFSAALVWLLSALAVLVPDLPYFVNLLLLFFMFVSPIGYAPSQVPASARLIVWANPMTYLIESFRFALIGVRETPWWTDPVFGAASLVLLALSGTLFRTLMPIFLDYE